MPKPIVVIVGRPNVGKSTLFNRITESYTAIIEDIPGVTRDRNYLDAEWDDKHFIVVDTGGFYPEPLDDIFLQIREQALFAIDEADVIIHLLDGKDGLVPSDREIARVLRVSGKKVLWAVNKIDGPTRDSRLYDFYPLGAEELWPVSAATGYGYDDMMEKLASLLPAYREEKTDYPKIAVVGRPNVGKSTLINTLLSKKRMIVSPIPGTTRDSIDSVCTYYGKKYLFIDTAGIRRKDMAGYSLERFAAVRAVKSILRCDVALIVLDASDGIVDQDQKIAGIVDSYGKGGVFLLNKWDLLHPSDDTYKTLLGEVGRKMWFIPYAPLLTVSALEKKRVTNIFPLIDDIIKERKKRIPTAELNKFFSEIRSTMTLPSYKGKTGKLNYITQVRTEPPTFTVFVNYPHAIKDSHIRHIEKILRNRFSFKGTPVRIYIKEKAPRK
ncbi:MAG: ribosome biogenesis GTPase Der [Thermodesulfovibrionales bacterium]|nr:ribosome biogenesis GTPase Der [Thermodesulfovibrionales bacterium]